MRPVCPTGRCTRRPSVVITTATWRRSCRSKRPNVVSPEASAPDVVGRCARSLRASIVKRNPAWFKKNAGRDEVYDWEYSRAEVSQIGERLRRIESDSTRAIVVANNHFHGKALKLIEDLLAWYREGGT